MGFPTPTRKSTLVSISDAPDDEEEEEALEMQRARRRPSTSSTLASPTPAALPPSVARCPLFTLPREIREVIYAHVLSSNLGFSFPSDTLTRDVHPALLRTSRALYAETAPLLYTSNKLIFSHPSDANMFRHAMAAPHAAAQLTSMIVRVKSSDVRLWTAYFNSTADERSLVCDFPLLRTLYLRFRGPRYQTLFSAEQNTVHWLRDQKLLDVILSVRKCVADVRVYLCVRVPDDWSMDAWDAAVERVVTEQHNRDEAVQRVVMQQHSQDHNWVPSVTRLMGYVSLYGVWLKLETDGM